MRDARASQLNELNEGEWIVILKPRPVRGPLIRVAHIAEVPATEEAPAGKAYVMVALRPDGMEGRYAEVFLDPDHEVLIQDFPDEELLATALDPED